VKVHSNLFNLFTWCPEFFTMAWFEYCGNFLEWHFREGHSNEVVGNQAFTSCRVEATAIEFVHNWSKPYCVRSDLFNLTSFVPNFSLRRILNVCATVSDSVASVLQDILERYSRVGHDKEV